MPSEPSTVSEDISAFFQEASMELGHQEGLLVKARSEGAHQLLRSVIPLALLVLVTAVIILRPEALLIWLIVGLLLYSYNFLILLLPTTTERSRPKEKAQLIEEGKDHRWLAIKLLARKKRLAIEIGLTVFLGGMVPLTLSFTVILGLGLFLVAYFVLTAYAIADGLAMLVTLQVAMIIFFYALMNILRPQAQGITVLAKAWKARIGIARSRGLAATTLVLMVILGLVTASATLFVGALILPGVTLASLYGLIGDLTMDDLLLVILVLAAQIWIMRSFQSFASRRMATTLLQARIAKLKELLTRLEVLNSRDGMTLDRDERFVIIRSEYYAMMIYDLIRLDFFGRAPVYLVGPRLKYVLDERVIAQVPG